MIVYCRCWVASLAGLAITLNTLCLFIILQMLSQPKLTVTQVSLVGAGITLYTLCILYCRAGTTLYTLCLFVVDAESAQVDSDATFPRGRGYHHRRKHCHSERRPSEHQEGGSRYVPAFSCHKIQKLNSITNHIWWVFRKLITCHRNCFRHNKVGGWTLL